MANKKASDRHEKSVLEKRLFQRRTLRTQVIFEDEAGEGFIYFYSTDISIGGVFLESDIPLKIGTRVFMSFALREGERPIRSIGRVVRVERDKEDSLYAVGMGLQFVDLLETSRDLIQEFVNS